MTDVTGVPEDVLLEVEGMSDADLTEEFNKLQANKARQAEYNKNHRTTMSPEAKEKQKERNQRKYAKNKAILARAKEVGLT